jgi:serine/threonine protein kinase
MDLYYDSPLGRGSSAEVWLATDSTQRRVAVKFFRGNTPDIVEEEAERHARALGRVDHSAVVRLYALERQTHPDDGSERLAVIMEYVHGMSLSRCARDFSAIEAVAIVDEIVAGLEAFHAAGLVHGDLHEGNIMITATGAKIIDPLCTHSLREVGTRAAEANKQEDIRQLAGIVRHVLEKNPIARRISSRVHSSYCDAIARAKVPIDVKKSFQYVLHIIHATATPTVDVDPQSLNWYFLYDEHPGHRVDTHLDPVSSDGLRTIRVLLRGYMDFDSNARYLCCYVPDDPEVEGVALGLIDGVQTLLTVFDGTEMTMSHESGADPPRSLSELQFTGRVFLYLERRLTVEQRQRIEQLARQKRLYPHVRDVTYAEMRNRL